MFPGINGFHWTVGHVIFLGAFFTVLTIIGITLVRAWLRTRKDLAANRVEALRWAADFGDLSPSERACRHAMTETARGRVCNNWFDCRVCEMHPKLAALEVGREAGPVENEIFGLEFPADRLYHRGHTWAKAEPGGEVIVGLDALAERLAGKPDSIQLPQPGERLVVNGTAWKMRKLGAEIRVLSPIEGEVLETGCPAAGWYLKIKPDSSASDAHLLGGAEVRPWVMRELERLQLTFAPTASLADGGVLSEDLSKNVPRDEWELACGEMFLNP